MRDIPSSSNMMLSVFFCRIILSVFLYSVDYYLEIGGNFWMFLLCFRLTILLILSLRVFYSWDYSPSFFLEDNSKMTLVSGIVHNWSWSPIFYPKRVSLWEWIHWYNIARGLTTSWLELSTILYFFKSISIYYCWLPICSWSIWFLD